MNSAYVRACVYVSARARAHARVNTSSQRRVSVAAPREIFALQKDRETIVPLSTIPEGFPTRNTQPGSELRVAAGEIATFARYGDSTCIVHARTARVSLDYTGLIAETELTRKRGLLPREGGGVGGEALF